MKIQKLMLLMISIFIFIANAYSQEKITTLTNKEKEQIIETICQRLIKFYVFPEVAEQMESHLKGKYKDGVFENITDPIEFANLATKELRSVCHDKHLALFFGPNPDLQSKEDMAIKRITDKIDRETINYGLSKVEVLTRNVGYLKPNNFMYHEPVKEIISSAIKFLSNTDALIIDIRENRGGDPQYIAYLLTFFFNKPTQLSSLYFRDRNKTYEFWTEENSKETNLIDIPIFVLISNKTFSAAESFAYDLQSLKRAVIIGEISAGGANPSSSFVVHKDLRITIPLGRAINPITKSNWEGTGVIPDVEVSADSSYLVALQIAQKAADNCHEIKKNKIIASYQECLNDLSKAEQLFEEKKNDEANNLVTKTLTNALNYNFLTQSIINQFGYNSLEQKKFEFAIAIFSFNVLAFPNSANTYDSLAEAFLKNGQTDLAIKNYKKSLELNPNNESAKDVLKELIEKK